MSDSQNNHKKIALTGDRPTGKLHLGHYIGSILNRIELQQQFESFYMVADVQALTDNAENPAKVRSNVIEVVLDNMAVGVDPAKMTMFIQSQIPQIAELTIFFLNLVTLARLKRNPTVKDEMKQKGYGDDVPAGFLAYPVSQTADILAFKANIVPVGEDQLPVLEQANEIGQKFNFLYGGVGAQTKSGTSGEIFPKIEPMIGEFSRLPGIDGKAKMSKSLGNAIYLSDSADEVERKVMQMYTDPNHIRVEDPGQVEGNAVFAYLEAFDNRNTEVEELKEAYRNGGLGDVELKRRLIGVLNEILNPIRDRREHLARDPKFIMDILKEGTKKAEAIAEKTLNEVKRAMQINYFS